MHYHSSARWLVYLATVIACWMIGIDGARAETPRRPNIIHIVADDLGWRDVGYHGSPHIKTPNIDKLAASGTRLERFYTTSLCTPTRACLMTGRYPFRYGLQTFVIPAALSYGLSKDERLLPQALKESGYYTAIIGKWHLGHGDTKMWPRQRGFDYQYGYLTSEIDYFTHKVKGATDWYRDNRLVEEKGYSTKLLGDDAVTLILKHDTDQPLYLYLAFNAPHTPYSAPEEYLEKYESIADPVRRTYASIISAMDDQIGRVVDALDKRKLRENTLILFHSDNGGLTDPKYAGEEPAPKVVSDNGPYRGGKSSLYEGGNLVVGLANWPGQIKPGSTVDELIHCVDLYPTIVGLAGGSLDKNKPLDGMDVWPTISQGKPSPRTEIVYNVEPSKAAIRQGDWKLVWYASLPPKVELFDLTADPYEKNNLAADNPDKVTALQRHVNELAATAVDPLFPQAELQALLKLPAAFPKYERED